MSASTKQIRTLITFVFSAVILNSLIFIAFYLILVYTGMKTNATMISTVITIVTTLASAGFFKPVLTFLINDAKESDNNKKESKIKQPDTPSLLKHNVFDRIKYIKHQVRFNFELNDKTKEAVFRDILYNKLVIWENLLRDFAKYIDNEFCGKKCGVCKLNEECVKEEIFLKNLQINIQVLNRGIYLYNNYFVGKYQPDEVEMIQYAMNQFNQYHAGAVDGVTKAIEGFHNNKLFYNCIKTINSAVFTAYTSAFDQMLNDAVMALNKLNGFYKNKSFKDKLLSSFDEELKSVLAEFNSYLNNPNELNSEIFHEKVIKENIIKHGKSSDEELFS